MAESQVEKIMRLLGCSEEEALDVIATDKIIDKGGRTQYDLTKEQEKEAMKMSRVDERKAKSADNKRGKVRAENPTKSGIIAEIAEFLSQNSQHHHRIQPSLKYSSCGFLLKLHNHFC